jgi:hypothetical protein
MGSIGGRRRLAAIPAGVALVLGLIVVPLAGRASATPTLTISQTTNLTAGTVVTWSVTGATPSVLSSLIECNGDPTEPTMSLLGNAIPVGCTPPALKPTSATGTASGTFTIKVGTVGPPSNTGNDSAGNPGSVDAPNYPCPPTQAEVDAGVVCVLAFGTTAAGGVDTVFVPIHFQGEPTTTTTTSTTSTSTTSTTTSTTSTTTTSTTTSSTSTTTTTVPSGGGPTTLDHCTGNFSVASIKNPLNGLGLVNSETNVKISAKSVGAATCQPTGMLSAAGPIDPASFKASIVGNASCDTSLTPPGLPPSGKFGFTQGVGTVKSGGYLRFASIDPTGAVYYADVVAVHGIMVKGPYAGTDVDGTLSQDPTVKDKTVPAVTYGPFVGYDVNPFDSLGIGASCLSGTSTGFLLGNDNHGATCTLVGKGCVAIGTDIKTTLVGDGTSLLEPTGLVNGAGGGVTPAQGLTFSVF